MEHAGTAVAAAAARALAVRNGREDRPVLILAGPGNNGGDGFVAARRLAEWGIASIAVLVAAEERPRTRDAARNWKRLDGIEGVTQMHAPVARDVAILGQGIEKAGIIVDALLGTGVRGRLREPVRTAVEVIRRAREAGVPVLAVDTPTAVDLTSGDPSDPVVRADLTVTFHRPEDRAADEDRAGARRARCSSRRSASRRRRTVPDVAPARASAEVLLVAGASPSSSSCSPPAITALLPREGQAVVFHTPLLIVVLIAGTAFVLWRILARARRPDRRPDDRRARPRMRPRSPLARRAADLERLADEHWDLLIVGGGIVGAGALLDAASRGLRVALVEQDDIASGTSSRSSRLIHGGLRYLQQSRSAWSARRSTSGPGCCAWRRTSSAWRSSCSRSTARRSSTRAFYTAGLTMYDVLGLGEVGRPAPAALDGRDARVRAGPRRDGPARRRSSTTTRWRTTRGSRSRSSAPRSRTRRAPRSP